MRLVRILVVVPTALTLVLTSALRAQHTRSEPHVIQWWEGAAVLGGVAALSTLDEPMQRYIQGHRSPAGDEVASVFRRMGEPVVFGTVTGGIFLAGVVARRPALRRASLRVATSLALAGVLSTTGKLLTGRPRPNEAGDADDLKLFSGSQSLPSGHTTMAFALATAVGNEVRCPWAKVALWAAAAGTGWSRVNDNKHWVSDVLAGAAVGVTSAELVDGHWGLFHLRSPIAVVGLGTVAVVWHASF